MMTEHPKYPYIIEEILPVSIKSEKNNNVHLFIPTFTLLILTLHLHSLH